MMFFYDTSIIRIRKKVDKMHGRPRLTAGQENTFTASFFFTELIFFPFILDHFSKYIELIVVMTFDQSHYY